MEVINTIPLNFKIVGGNARPTNIEIAAVGKGLINDTYLVNISTEGSHTGTFTTNKRYILQRINTHVFQNVDNLMSNIEKVSKHLQAKVDSRSVGASTSCCLVVVYTNENKLFWRGKSEEYWRMYHYIPNSITFTVSPGERYLYEAGRAYGQFQRDLSDLATPEELHETLVDFHNTPKRMVSFRRAVLDDKCKRAQNARDEISYIESKAAIVNVIFDMLFDERLPKRVAHNDTKLENVLFDVKTRAALCVVDYDTIMPNGSILYDYGDAIRSMSNTSPEDEKDLGKVDFDLLSFQRFTEGFLKELRMVITEKEKDTLPTGALVITFEQTIRFLSDYLMGDIYFKIDYPNHNLDRARNQLKLFKGMLANEKEMFDVVRKINLS